MGRLEGKRAVVTGGGSGTGFAITERFAGECSEVILVGGRTDGRMKDDRGVRTED